MRCGGCGSKIAGDVLSAALGRLDVGEDARVVLGCRAGEDAAVHRGGCDVEVIRRLADGARPGDLIDITKDA